MQTFFIGVDGGATKCVARVEDEEGRLLGREVAGPANIRLSVPQTWQSIYAALEVLLNPLGIKFGDNRYRWHVGMGLAGCEVKSAYEEFLAKAPEMDTLVISSDAHTACLGAHGGEDGAIIIIGTGVVGFQVEAGETTKVSGWGFPHDDEGGGAWLGLQAVNHTLKSLDGRADNSELAQAIYAHFDNDLDQFVSWANAANSTAFAELAPIVVNQSEGGNPLAIRLLQEAARAIDAIAEALVSDQTTPLPCCLIGGISPFVQAYVGPALSSRLRPCEATPDAGAVLLVRSYVNRESFFIRP